MTEPSKIWLLLIDHNFQVVGDIFSVGSTSDSTIEDLKERAKEEMPGDLSHIAPLQLTVWRCMDPTTTFDNEDLERQVSEVFSSNSVKELNVMARMAKLNISENEILFVKLPGQPVITSDQVGSPIISQMDPEYKHCLLYAHSKGDFTFEDIELNNIVDAKDRDVPEFVKKYKQMLARKRKVADNVRCFLSYHVFSF
ncbi:hypothetical protein EDB89DRAFT_1936360 [Lactarius sanguifluus]|nr:hypothetical protein EDB89DRAFT_1936360 [Lactarius sanguifluus]